MMLFSIILMDLLTGMEFDLFVPSFTQLQIHFHVSAFWVETLLSANFIGYCLSLFVVGELADRYGRKPIILCGLIIFILGSMCCLLSSTWFILIVLGRFLQGIGIAAPAILSFLIIADRYPIKQQQFLMSMLNGTINIATAVAPIIGSFIALYFHWQGNFVTLLSLGVIAFIMSLFFVPHTATMAYDKKALTSYNYLTLFQSKPLMLLVITLIFIYIPYWIFVGLSPLLYIKSFGVTLAHFGYYQGSYALVFAIGSIWLGFIVHRYQERKMLIVTTVLLALGVGSVGVTAFYNSTHPLVITLSLMPFIIGQIIPSTVLYPICLNFVPEAKAKISALLQGGKLILSALGLQIAAYLYDGSFRSLGSIITLCMGISVVLLGYVIKSRNLKPEHR